MPVSEAQIMSALSQVNDPELGKDVVSLGMIKNLKIEGENVDLTLELTTPACPVSDQFKQSVHDAVVVLDGVSAVNVTMGAQVRGSSGSAPAGGNSVSLPNVRNIIAVGAGKGGVGKSTVAVNLAIALQRTGASIGLLDADIYGPNVPNMMGITDPVEPKGEGIPYEESYGVRVISMGFFIPEGQAVVWRGPMIHGALQQMLKDVDWGELDYLIIDLPPGTGDASLSLAQLVPLTGAVIVLTPSEVALEDGVKAISMFRKLEVPLLGLIENMSYFTCPHCDGPVDIFGRGASKRVCQQYDIEFLGEIPIDPMVRIGGDDGIPASIGAPESPTAKQFAAVARGLAGKISIQNLNRTEALPTIQMYSASR
jgi:ATP-binding protein involved in chromosome partitioning